MLLTSLLTPIATGLMTTLKVSMPLANIIVYQTLLGFGAGIGWQGPQVAAQSVCKDSDIPLGIATIMFAQNFGPALSLPIAQTLFQGQLVRDVEKYAPGLGVSAGTLESIGLSDLRRAVGVKELASLLVGYDKAITQTFYLPVGLACATLVGSAAIEWVSVKKKTN